jgi:hypothetical protein
MGGIRTPAVFFKSMFGLHHGHLLVILGLTKEPVLFSQEAHQYRHIES